MPSTISNNPTLPRHPRSTPEFNLISHLQSDYPEFRFHSGPKFAFTPPKTIILGPPQPNYALLTLHELAHAILNHKHDNSTISLLKHERDAWEHVKTHLAPKYSIPYDEDFAQDKLDTYRNHLHHRSLCPTCATVRYEDPTGAFHCPFCP